MILFYFFKNKINLSNNYKISGYLSILSIPFLFIEIFYDLSFVLSCVEIIIILNLKKLLNKKIGFYDADLIIKYDITFDLIIIFFDIVKIFFVIYILELNFLSDFLSIISCIIVIIRAEIIHFVPNKAIVKYSNSLYFTYANLFFINSFKFIGDYFIGIDVFELYESYNLFLFIPISLFSFIIVFIFNQINEAKVFFQKF